MRCEKIKEKFADYLIGDLDEKSLTDIQAHLASCSSCRDELESLSAIWTKLGVLPQEQPSPALRQRFYSMLEAFKEGMEEEEERASFGEVISAWFGRVMPRRPVYQLALSLVLLVAGLAGGYLLSGRTRSAAKIEVAALRQEVKNMRQLAAISLLKQKSPSDRLMGVSYGAQLEQPDQPMIETLLDTLNHDSNVNVRLAAADALYLFYDHPQVKDGLVRSLSQQTSPLVQLTLIDLLVEIRERRATEALRTLIQNEKLNHQVKKRAELGLAQLS
jgi:hypothetical protein